MSLHLPYFKLDVIDWLKSEKIEAMSNACIGAYIVLLCEAWTRPSCSLPSARLALMKLARWTSTEEEFAPVLQCFEPLKGDRTRVVNPRLKREWDETSARLTVLSEAGKRGAQIKRQLHEAKPKRTISTHPTPHDDFEQFWVAYPKKVGKKAAQRAWTRAKDKPPLIPLLAVIQQATHSDQWTKEQGQFIPNPATWLNEGRWTDQPRANGAADGLCTQCTPPKKIAPEKLKEHCFIYHPKLEY